VQPLYFLDDLMVVDERRGKSGMLPMDQMGDSAGIRDVQMKLLQPLLMGEYLTGSAFHHDLPALHDEHSIRFRYL
jgi:hypothetical protein